MLDPRHEFGAVEANHSRIDAGIHDSERICGRDEAVVRLEVFETALYDVNARQPRKPLTERVAHFNVGMHEP
jgi:hypothetical protein